MVVVTDVDYSLLVPKELRSHACVLTHNLFSVIRIDGRGALSSEILRKLLGRNSAAIMQKLEGTLIELERDYSAGYHCRFYRFVPGFTRFCCKTITDPLLVRAWFRNTVNRKQPIHRWLDKILAEDKLEFDSDGANEHLDRLTNQEFLALDKSCSMENYVAGVRQSIARAGNMRTLYLAQSLNLSTVEEFGHRYHTPLTSLPKRRRGYFRWSGEPLVNVDIRNSQPLFLCLAFAKAGGVIKDDWKRYKDLCERGCLYESLNWSNIDRAEFKERFFEEVLFSKPETVLYKKFTQKFFTEFESVFQFIFDLKNPKPPRAASVTGQVVNGFIVGLTLVNGGYGYTDHPIVKITGAGGSGASAVVAVTNSEIVSLSITSPGSGYPTTTTVDVVFGAESLSSVVLSTSRLVVGAALEVSATTTAGVSYQWLSSNDLKAWLNQGNQFTATTQASKSTFGISSEQQCYRLIT